MDAGALTPRKPDPHVLAHWRKLGRKGGLAVKAKQTPEERREIGRRAVLIRWNRVRYVKPIPPRKQHAAMQHFRAALRWSDFPGAKDAPVLARIANDKFQAVLAKLPVDERQALLDGVLAADRLIEVLYHVVRRMRTVEGKSEGPQEVETPTAPDTGSNPARPTIGEPTA